MQISKKRFYDTFKKFPKAEIHIHLMGIIKPNTVFKLIKKNNINTQYKTKQRLNKLFQIKTLSEFIHLFLFIQDCFLDADDFRFVFNDLREYYLKNNVKYFEMNFAPSKFLQNGLLFKNMVHVLSEEIKKCEQLDGVKIRLLMEVSRTFGLENAKHNLDLVLANRIPEVIGIDLGGDEEKGPAKDFEPVFKKAIRYGLKVVAHAGEDQDSFSIWNTLKFLKAARIGHGTSAMHDQKLMDYIRDHKIPLEINPTSNVFTGKYVKKISEHPVRQFFDHGIIVTLNTDDPGIFSIDLLDEYYNLYEYLNFSIPQLIQICKNNWQVTFLTENEKQSYIRQIEELTES